MMIFRTLRVVVLSTLISACEAAASPWKTDKALFIVDTHRGTATLSATTKITRSICVLPLSKPSRFGGLVALRAHRMSSPPPNIIPFVVDRIDSETPDRMSVLKAISKMCIQVFFNESHTESEDSPRATPWRTIQIAQLRSLMYADLRFTSKSRKEMFVARRVIPAPEESEDDETVQSLIESEPVVVDDSSRIYNREHLHRVEASSSAPSLWVPRKQKSKQPMLENSAYIKGEVLGYVEVGEKSFPLGPPFDVDSPLENDEEEEDDIFLRNPAAAAAAKRRRAQALKLKMVRPIIANLAVKREARRSGVGSRLVEACEAVVSSTWSPPCPEIVLQVEEDNPRALHFYQKRGYQVVFSDPSCRRYDINGFFLRREPIAKIAMRKSLAPLVDEAEANGKVGLFSGASQMQLAASDVWQTLCGRVFAVSSR